MRRRRYDGRLAAEIVDIVIERLLEWNSLSTSKTVLMTDDILMTDDGLITPDLLDDARLDDR
jgi:hypothetical protein